MPHRDQAPPSGGALRVTNGSGRASATGSGRDRGSDAVYVRMEPGLLVAIDQWAKRAGIEGRPAAIRALVIQALKVRAIDRDRQ